MTFEQLFRLFYTKYRGEENPPSTTDPEWEIGISNYNNALDRLEEYDDTRWDFLKTTLQASTQVSPVLDRTLTTGDTTFTAPNDMLFPGGIYWTVSPQGTRSAPRKTVKPEDVGLLTQTSDYLWFLGDQHNGYVAHISPTVPAQLNGYGLDYIYYKKAPRLVADSSDPDFEDGTSIITGAPAKFFACYMTAQRLLDSRNFPGYQVMLRDAEESLKNAKLRNNSGDYYNNIGVQDSGPGFGF